MIYSNLSLEVAFKVKYVDVKGTEKNFDIKGQEGEKLLDTVKMAGIPIRCIFCYSYLYSNL